jgi:predicted amidohydrolase
MKKRQPIIALAQIEYDPRKKNNIDKIIKYIKEAKRKKADIVCFPESCICRTKTLHFDDELIKQLKIECKKNSIWCIITEDIILRGKPYNMSILIDRNGKVKGNYKKIHLYGDSEELNAGKKIKVLQTDFAKIGIAICWDLAFPELFKKMKKAGAEIVFCPAQWAYEQKAHDKQHKKREKEILESLILARAFENLYFVALGNPVRKYEKEQVSYSAIASPHKILKEIVGKEGLITAKINLGEIKKFEKIYPN